MTLAYYYTNFITNSLFFINEQDVALETSNVPQVSPALHRVFPFDEDNPVLLLERRIEELQTNLGRKYRHCKMLQKQVDGLMGLKMVSQSGSDDAPPPGIMEMESQTASTEQITAFADQDAGWTTKISGNYEATMDLGNNSDTELGKFLERPIRQSAQSWIVGDEFYYKFNPWTAFCQNPYVRNKITNYQLLRMKLHCKMVISGTKFHYGRALVSYNPFSRGDEVTVERAFIQQDLIQASQKPHHFLNPTTNTGGELCLPFFYDKNFMEIPDADWGEMGDITIKSFGNLLHANGGNDPVTITIYLWAEDVVLTVPTYSAAPILISQAGKYANTINGDEYGSGIISKPAAAIAKAAGALSSVPVIGPYMTASKIASGAVANVAKLFGYSRPTIITDIVLTKPSPVGNLANTDAADAAMKLTMDSKCELTVDSRTVGLDGSDQMGIVDMACRESYLTTFDWSPDETPDQLLWNTRVLPMQLDNVQGEIHMTPLAAVATAFESWQGSLKFRFQVVKSDFHKGRILVRWDPNQLGSEVSYNTNYSRVIDIAETDDFEIVVGWGQSAPWKECGEPYSAGSNFSANSRIVGNTTQGNGILELAVLNDLVSPSIDAPISINVFVSACDDIKFAGPTNSKMHNIHLFNAPPPELLASQSGSSTETLSDKPTASGELVSIASKSDPNDQTYLVYYGDPPSSIRELCKRYTYTRYWLPEAAEDDAVRINVLRNKNMPYYSGYDPDGIDLTVNSTQITASPTAFSSWFTPCFAGQRGSFRKKYMFSGTSNQAPHVTRYDYLPAGNGYIISAAQALSKGSVFLQKFLSLTLNPASGSGCASTNIDVNNTVEVEFPFYSDRRFTAARTIKAQNLQCNSHTVATTSFNYDTIGPTPAAFDVAYQQHDAVGEDWSLFFFTGVPIMYKYNISVNT
jgi:hypothetical protein